MLIEESPEGRFRMKWRGRYLKIREVAKALWKESCIPGPDHPWRKRTFLLGRKADISILR